MNKVRGNRGLIVVGGFLAVMGIILLLQSAELKGKFPLPAAQPANVTTERWAAVETGPLPVFVQGADGKLSTFAVLQAGDRMKVLGRAGDDFIVVGLDDGRKAIVTAMNNGGWSTDLRGSYVDLPRVSFP